MEEINLTIQGQRENIESVRLILESHQIRVHDIRELCQETIIEKEVEILKWIIEHPYETKVILKFIYDLSKKFKVKINFNGKEISEEMLK